MRQSRSSSQHIWVACNDGRIFCLDWTKANKGLQPSFTTKSKTARAMSVIPIKSKNVQDAVLVLETSEKPHAVDLVAYTKSSDNAVDKDIFNMKKSGFGLQLLETSEDGLHIIGAVNDRLFVGVTSAAHFESFEDVQYEFFSFDTPDTIASLDVRTKDPSSKKAKNRTSKVVDVLVGGARGGIYMYRDLVARLEGAGKSKAEESLQAQKYHWHRKAVHSVKWSRDGNYMISGGSENALVMWQLDTGKRDYLPHLSGSVENVVVSAAGSSYVVHLDDNSVMVISTSEMKPTAYVSGIQSASVNVEIPKDFLVRRNWESPVEVRRRIPAAIRPGQSSKLHVCVGNGMQATVSGDFSAPYLQSFDLETFTSITRQPLARTQPTDVNMTNKGTVIDEPVITHMSFSANGRWLASVDDWKPAGRDVENVSSELQDQFLRERHEVYLKFWDMHTEDGSAALTSRINAPHATIHPESVLDLVASPVSPSFATIGSDGMVRIWRSKVRSQNGIIVKGLNGQELSSWSCAQVIPVGDGLGHEVAVESANLTGSSQPQGSLSFSEDGSTIFAAFGHADTGVVSVIDAASGETIKTLEGLWAGQLKSIEALSPFLVVLSDELRVYDVVGDELRYGVKLPATSNDIVLLQADRRSKHFAVAFPDGQRSSVGIFDPEDPEPLLVRSIPHKVVSLVAPPDTAGFVALDDSAQIWTISEESSTLSLAAAQPLEDLRLDGPIVDGDGMGAIIGEGVDMDSDDEAEQANGQPDVDVDMDDSTHASVIAPQHLAEIFDAAPPFAGPSIEDLFYKVTSLVGSKPLVAASE